MVFCVCNGSGQGRFWSGVNAGSVRLAPSLWLVWLSVWLAISASAVWGASPELSLILPRGVQRGAEAELTFHGQRLEDTAAIFFYSPGFEVLSLEPTPTVVKARVRVAADCRLGEHVAQLRTRSGISEFRTFYVGPFPAISEKEPNSEFSAPQPVPLNITIDGIVDNEDVDYFVVEAKKGQRISADVEAMRLGTTLFDPYLAILDAKRFELAASDDTPLAFQDAAVSIVAPEDGQYIIELRESAYGGNGNCRYRLHVGTFPVARAVYPPGGKRGEPLDVTFVGDPAGVLTRSLRVPDDPSTDWVLHAEDSGGVAPTGMPFRLFDHGNVLEQEPNDVFAQATPAELPLAFNGIIEKPGDVDCFVFEAHKGQVWEVECYARRLRSPLDSVMTLYYADGRGIAGDDDARAPDSYLRFSVPEDGKYIVRITDHLGRGGPEFVYRIEFKPIQPSLSLSIPRVSQYSQYRQTIFVPRGSRFGAVINAARSNFSGELVLEPSALPAGVTMVCDPMPASVAAMPVVFEAAADAPLDGMLIDLRGRCTDPNQPVVGHFSNRADLVLGPPGQSLYWTATVERLAVAVVEELPFRLEIQQPKAPLVRDGSMQLRIVAHRRDGFTKPIHVELPFLPPGVGAASSVQIPEGQNEVLYPLNAAGNAQEGTWGIFALGAADINGQAWTSSQLARLTVATQPVSLELSRAACEQGQSVQILGKVTVNTQFEGKATMKLIGLPPKVECPPVEFASNATEVVFTVNTAADSPPGQHKNIFAEVSIPFAGETIVLRAGNTELQIDRPLPKAAPPPQPAPAAQPAPQPPPQQPMQPAEKPLSRLEKLRREAQQRRAGGG
jgi:hypothetical protein